MDERALFRNPRHYICFVNKPEFTVRRDEFIVNISEH